MPPSKSNRGHFGVEPPARLGALGVYRPAKPANDNNAALMRRIDEQFTALAVSRLAADDRRCCAPRARA